MNSPALELKEHELMVVGQEEISMLVRLEAVKMAPPEHILEKTKEIIEAQQGKSLFTNTKLDRFWAKRYLLFEKFDYGIKLD